MDFGVQNGQGNLLSAASQIDDIFAGLHGEDLSPVFGSDAEPVFSAAGASEPVQESAPSVTEKAPEVSPENAPAAVTESSAESLPETTVEAAKNPTIPAPEPETNAGAVTPDIGSISDQSNESLFTANGPPVEGSGSSDTLLFAASGLIPSDLLSNIESKLNEYANSIIGGEQVFTFGDQDLGGVLSLTAPTLTFRNISFSGSGTSRVFTGTIQITTASASLNAGSGISVSAEDGTDTDAFAVTGSYTLFNQAPKDGSFSLLLDRLKILIAGFAELHASNVALQTSSTTSETGGSVTRDFRLGASGVDAFLGAGPLFLSDGSVNPSARGVRVSSADLGLLIRKIDANEADYVFEATGNATLLGFSPDLTLAGTGWKVEGNTLGNLSQTPVIIGVGSTQISLDSTTTGFTFAGSATLTTTLGGFTGNFSVASQTNDKGTPDDDSDDVDEVLVGATGVSLFVGDDKGNGPGTDDVGVRVSSASLMLVARPNGTFALEASGDATVVNLAALDLTGSFGVQLNTTGAAVAETFTVGGVTKTLDLPGGVSRYGGTLTLVTPVADVTGSFSVEVQSGEVIFGATNVQFFVGDKKGTTSTADDTGLLFSNGTLLLVILSNNTYAFDAAGDAAIVNVPGLDFVGTFSAQRDTTGTDIDRPVTIGAGAQQVARQLTVARNTSRFGGNLTLRTPVADLTGAFTVEVQTNNNGTSGNTGDDFKEVLIAATGVEVFLGDKQGAGDSDDVGLQISGATLALLLLPANTYAFRVTGTATLVNVPDLTFTGTFAAEVNTTGADVSRSITLGSGAGQVITTLQVEAGVSRFGGDDVVLASPVGDLRGNFAFQTTTNDNDTEGDDSDDFTEVLVGATAVRVTVGGTAGVRITNGNLLLLVRRNTADTANVYAFDASGSVELYGVSAAGLSFSGNFSAQQNTTGAAVDRVLTVGSQTRRLNLASDVSRFGGTAVQLVVGGQSLSGNFSFEEVSTPSPLVRITAANVNLLLGGAPNIASVTDAAGVLELTATGVTGSLTGDLDVNLPGVAFSTQFGVSFANSGGTQRFTVSANTATLTILDQVVIGNFTLERIVTADGEQVVKVSANGVGADLGGGLVTLVAGTGNLLFTNAGVAGRISGTITIPASADFTFGSGFELAVNTIAADVNESFGSDTLVLPAGPYIRLAADGVNVTVLGHTLTGNFAFEKAAASGGGSIIRIAASEVTLTFSNGGSDILELTDGAGSFVISTDGLAGRLSGTVAVTVPGVEFDATLALELNTTGSPVSEAFTVGGVETTLALDAGDYVRVIGNDVSLAVLGQRLSGDFTFEKSGATVSVTVDNFSLAFGDGTNDLVTVSQGTAAFTLSEAGIVGSLLANVAANIPGLTLGGTLTVEVDTTNSSSRFVRATGSSVTVAVLGQTLGGTFTVEQATTAGADGSFTTTGDNETVVRLGVTGLTLQIQNGGATIVNVTSGTGALLIDRLGVAAAFDATATVTFPGNSGVSGNFGLRLNTRAAAVDETFRIGAGTSVVLDVPAGPFLRVSATNFTATIAGHSLVGNFVFDQTTLPGTTKVTRIAFSEVAVSLADGGDTLGVTDAEGFFVGRSSGVAGVMSGAAAANVGGVSLTGRAGFRINNTGAAIDDSIVIDGRTLRVEFGEGETSLFQFFAEDLALNIGNFVTIEGNVTFATVNGNTIFAGEGLEIFIGQGPARLPNGELNPVAVGMLVTDASVGLVRFGSSNFTYALVATGTVSVIGVDGVTATGTCSRWRMARWYAWMRPSTSDR